MTTTKQNFINYLTPAILLTLPSCLVFGRLAVFCLPLGIVAIVYKAQAKTRLEVGDHPGAHKASKSAKKWFWFGFIPVGIILVVVQVYILQQFGEWL